MTSSEDFLNNDSFLGIFLSSYSKRQDIVGYISMILNPIILSVDNNDKECLDLSINSIKKYLEKKNKGSKAKKRNKSEEKMDFSKGPKAIKDFLFGKIPKTKIKFKKNIELEAQKENEDDIKIGGHLSKDDNELNAVEKKINYKRLRRTMTDKTYLVFYKEIEYNRDYLHELNYDKFLKKLKDSKDGDLKDFYIK